MVKLKGDVSHSGVGYLVEYVACVAGVAYVTVGGTWLTVMVHGFDSRLDCVLVYIPFTTVTVMTHT